MGGRPAWKSSDATPTWQHIRNVLKPVIVAVMIGGGFLYASPSMKVGIDVPTLVKYSMAISALLKLDTRGGHLLLADVEKALEALFQDETVTHHVDASVMKQHMGTRSALITRTSWAIRVMLSHIRIKRSDYMNLMELEKKNMKSHPDALIELYKIITVSAASPARSKPNPFIAFREKDDDNDSIESTEEDLKPLFQIFDYQTCKALCVMSDGANVPADSYSQGDDGFVIAHFKDGLLWATSLPNTCYDPASSMLTCGAPLDPKALKKPTK